MSPPSIKSVGVDEKSAHISQRSSANHCAMRSRAPERISGGEAAATFGVLRPAIIHHTDCGSTLLADDEVRHGFAERIGVDERTLADTPVLDPARTVRTDVERVLWAEEIPQDVHVSGHVYDLDTGLVTTIVDAKSRK